MKFDELQNAKFYRLTLAPIGNGMVVTNARVRCIVNNRAERHLVVDDARFGKPMQWRVESNGQLTRFDYGGQWISDGSNIADSLTEEGNV